MALTYEEKRAVAREVSALVETDVIREGIVVAFQEFPSLLRNERQQAVITALISHCLTIGYAHGRGIPLGDLRLTDEEKQDEMARLAEHYTFFGGAS